MTRHRNYETRMDDVAAARRVRSVVVEQEGPPEPPHVAFFEVAAWYAAQGMPYSEAELEEARRAYGLPSGWLPAKGEGG